MFISFTGFCFGSGTTSPCFHDCVSPQSLIEEFRISFTGSDNSAFFFNSQVGIPSGPLALVGLSFISFVKTSCLVTKKNGFITVKICAKRVVIWQWREVRHGREEDFVNNVSKLTVIKISCFVNALQRPINFVFGTKNWLHTTQFFNFIPPLKLRWFTTFQMFNLCFVISGPAVLPLPVYTISKLFKLLNVSTI